MKKLKLNCIMISTKNNKIWSNLDKNTRISSITKDI